MPEWEPIMPSVAVANEAYAFLFMKHLGDKDNVDLQNAVEHARHLMHAAFDAHQERRRHAA